MEGLSTHRGVRWSNANERMSGYLNKTVYLVAKTSNEVTMHQWACKQADKVWLTITGANAEIHKTKVIIQEAKETCILEYKLRWNLSNMASPPSHLSRGPSPVVTFIKLPPPPVWGIGQLPGCCLSANTHCLPACLILHTHKWRVSGCRLSYTHVNADTPAVV